MQTEPISKITTEQMILHWDREGNDCIWKLQCHCIQIFYSDIYSVLITIAYSSEEGRFQKLLQPIFNVNRALKNRVKCLLP